MTDAYDAVVVGAGPNGLAAAVELARADRSVLVLEAADTVGGGARSQELTLPGFLHDVCSAIHPLGVASPFLRALPLAEHGLEWIQPPAPLAHPVDGGVAAIMERSVEETAAGLGSDGSAYRRLFGPFVDSWEPTLNVALGPRLRLPRHPLAGIRLGLQGLRSGAGLSRGRFEGAKARALLAGLTGHSVAPLERSGTAAVGLVLGAAGHAVGWPLARGGSRRIVESLASLLRSLAGEIVVGTRVRSLDDIPRAGAVLLDVTPRQLIEIAGDRLPAGYRRRLDRYRHGPGVFKV
ncbi:MAG: phytoene desaturase family protein, partial [Acidimicrobiia bacterium]